MTEFIDNNTLLNKSTYPWIEKYRPEYINQVVSHENILRILKNLIEQNNFPHAILYGPPGSGKTTTIKACAREMYGENYSQLVLELNSSSDRGIKIIRNQIDIFCQHDLFNNTDKKQKLIILDEADSMTIDAQSALRSVITEYTATTRFCLICNYITKIIEPLISRCTVFIFSPIPDTLHFQHLKNIVEFENINIDNEALNETVKISKGDMRYSINILQSLSMINGTNPIDINTLYNNICQLTPLKMKNLTNKIFDKTIKFDDLIVFLKDLEILESLNISDIINIISEYIIEKKLENSAKIFIELEKIEYNMSIGSTSYLQLCNIASIIKKYVV